MPSGTEFIKHEFDEAIAIQQSIVESGAALSTSHPVAAVKRQLKSHLKVDREHLTKLRAASASRTAPAASRRRSRRHSDDLADETAKKAGKEESEAYEAHAVLLNLKRKQQDSAGAMDRRSRATARRPSCATRPRR